MNADESCSSSSNIEDSMSKEINPLISTVDTTEAEVVLDQNYIENDAVQQETLADKPLTEENDDEFIRITAAHKILTEAKVHDEQNNYSLALQFYRICVDFLLEELMFAPGTEQSRVYLREKSTTIMDRIDLLKAKLNPMVPSALNQQSSDNLSVDQLESLSLN